MWVKTSKVNFIEYLTSVVVECGIDGINVTGEITNKMYSHPGGEKFKITKDENGDTYWKWENA